MKIDSLNNSSTNVVKNEFGLVEKALFVSIIVVVVIEFILLTLLLTGVGSALPLTVLLCIFFVILVVLAIALLKSCCKAKRFFKVEDPQKPPDAEKPKELLEVEKPKELPKTLPSPSPHPLLSLFFKTLVSSEEEKMLVKNLLIERQEKRFLSRCLQKLSLEEACNMRMIIVQNPLEMIRANAMKSDLEKWAKNKISSLAYLENYSPLGDGNCLLTAMSYAMRKEGLEIPSSSVLRINIVEFLKESLLRSNVGLMYILNDLIEVLINFEEHSASSSFSEKKAIICQKCSLFNSDISKHTTLLNIFPGNNITSYITTYNNKLMENLSLITEFLDFLSRPGVFLGPAAVYALALQLGVTIFLYTSLPLTETNSMFKGEENSDLIFCETTDNRLAMGGLPWEKNIIVFNPEAKSERPICLGLVVNHFIFLNMGEKL